MREEVKMKRIEEGRARAIKYMKECMDDRGVLDITAFRNMHRSEYSKLSTYFGSVENALKEVGAIKATSQKGAPTLCQKLAYDMIKEATKTKNIAQLAREYNVTRMALNQLYKQLEKIITRETANA